MPWYGILGVLRVQCSRRLHTSPVVSWGLMGMATSGLGRYWVQSVKGDLRSCELVSSSDWYVTLCEQYCLQDWQETWTCFQF